VPVRNVTTGIQAAWLTPITQLTIAVSPYIHRRAAKAAVTAKTAVFCRFIGSRTSRFMSDRSVVIIIITLSCDMSVASFKADSPEGAIYCFFFQFLLAIYILVSLSPSGSCLHILPRIPVPELWYVSIFF
jgi:hypothetical protein